VPEPWIVYFLIFAFAFGAAQLLQVGLTGLLRGRRRTGRRFRALYPDGGGPDPLGALRRRESRLGEFAIVASLANLHRQSGTSFGPGALATAALVVGLLAYGLLPIAPTSGRLVASALLASLALYGYLRVKRGRRLARFGEQLPEVIDVIVRSLRAGHPLPVSLSLVARETPEPAGPEFAIVVDEVNYGRSISEALENLSERVGYPELRFLVASVSIAQQTGGNLGEVLARLARILRERFRLARRARALSAEGRFSGIALSALPIILFGGIQLVSASYYADFWTSPAAGTIVAVSIGLLAIGNLAIYRMVNFKV
jgi:tight adherence protein B